MRRTWLVGLAAVAITLTGCGESSESADSAPTTATRTTVPTTAVDTFTQPPLNNLSFTLEATATTTTAAPTRNMPAGSVSEATWTSGEWPFTVSDGTLQCSSGRVTFTANRAIYALNGAAKSAGGFDDVAPIWKDSSFAGVKVDLGPVIDQGLALC